MSAAVSAPVGEAAPARSTLPPWWPLLALTVAAAALRLSTLDLQSFWYDEAFTPVHVLHASLAATLRSVVHTENTPPLWYLVAWADVRLFGDGEVALRLPSALAGIATVPMAWAIGAELAGRRAALACAALVAVNPLLVWYSQEARAYALFVLASALALLCFLRARREPTGWRMAAFALTGALALLSHYFAVFLLVPMVLWLLYERSTRRAALPAVAALAAVGLALVPLISAQGGHGTQWIGRWPLGNRLEAIPQYYLTGYSGAPLGHAIELLVAVPILVGLGLGATRLDPRARRGAQIVLSVTAVAILAPIALALLGADYLAPRNLVAAMVPLTALIAVVICAADQTVLVAADGGPQGGLRAGPLALTLMFLAFVAVSIDVDLSPRLQRGNWRSLAHALSAAAERPRAITTVELGAAPLEYYLPGLHPLARASTITVSEIDETGYAPLRAGAARVPAPGFHLVGRTDVDGLIAYRFRSAVPRPVSEATLRAHVITLATPAVLVAGNPPSSTARPQNAAARTRPSFRSKSI